MSTIDLSLSYLKWQRDWHLNHKRFNIIVGGRGVGKSKNVRNHALESLLTFNESFNIDSRPIIGIVMENSVDANNIHFKPLCDYLYNTPFKHLIEDINKIEKRIRFKGNYPDILIGGCGNDGYADSWRGNSFFKIIIDEAADITHLDYIIDEVFAPRLDFKSSSLTTISSPKGKGTKFHKLYEKYSKLEEATTLHLTSYDNPFNDKKRLDDLKITLTPRAFRQEILASFEDFEGQIFDNFNSDKNTLNNYNDIQFKGYYLGLDCGSINTAFVVVGIDKDNKFYVLDYFWNNSKDPYTTEQIIDKVNQYSSKYSLYRICVPDDRLDVMKSIRNKGYSQAVGVERNSDFIRPAHRYDIIDNLFYRDRLFLLQSQSDFINEIISFRRDEDGKVIKGQNNHKIDALGYVLGYLFSKVPEYR